VEAAMTDQIEQAFDAALAHPPPSQEEIAAAVKAIDFRKCRRVPTPRPPDGLWTEAEAAAKLRCSIKTLKSHVAAGRLKYVSVGHGTKRQRRMFNDADLNEFISNQTRKDVPCPSTRTHARRTGNTISAGEVIAFTAQPRPRPGVKPKR
jgi:hypothetical protein